MTDTSKDAIKTERRKVLAEACAAVGGEAKLAEMIGKTRSHVSTWKYRGMIPPEMALPIEAATGIPRHRLRPDLYPPQDSAA